MAATVATLAGTAVGVAGVIAPIAGVNNVFYQLFESIETYNSNFRLYRNTLAIVESVLRHYRHVVPGKLDEFPRIRDALADALRCAVRRCQKYERFSAVRRYVCASAIQKRLDRSIDIITKLDQQYLTLIGMSATSYYEPQSHSGFIVDGSESPITQ